MIKSILDSDLYKFSMSYAYMTLFPEAEGEFQFKDRDNTEYDKKFLSELNRAIAEMCMVGLKEDEKEGAFNLLGSWIPRHYWEWLSTFKFDQSKITVYLDEEKHLQILVKDLMYKATLYEVPLLVIVSEVRNNWLGYHFSKDEMIARLDEKIDLSNREQLYFSEFGTRRRFSGYVQDLVCKRLKERGQYYVGTSNVYYALRYGTKALGTMAHEFVSAHLAFYGYRMGNYMMMENWSRVFDGNLGTVLTDTITNEVFFKNFSRKHAKLFDSVRHDSGDEFKYIGQVVKRYKELGVDPTTKSIIFSNALTMEKFKEISDACKGRIKMASAGIGTNLTNDTGNKPANIVMKLVGIRMTSREEWIPCIKLSDDLGKAMGDPEEIQIAKLTLGL